MLLFLNSITFKKKLDVLLLSGHLRYVNCLCNIADEFYLRQVDV